MNEEELEQILADHKLWLETGKKEGKRANLSGANLTEANLRGADLNGADLTGAILKGTILEI